MGRLLQLKTYYNVKKRVNFRGDVKAVGDITGIICRKKDIRKVMQYNGEGLYWTGLYEHKDHILKPTIGNLKPPVYKDPSSVLDMRPPQPNPPIPPVILPKNLFYPYNEMD